MLKKKTIKSNNIKYKLNYQYLKEQHLESIELINFITEIEKNFKIIFSSKDTESESFRTLNGISKIIFKDHIYNKKKKGL